ncbi:Glutathione peroxidase [Chthoniobacter flavus Ellin428]|uniref:Glutathione peroxidase n=1 Tax=Chthoniobacter flavus Ellin428 TaxID=497964 RepID=B4D8D3_9BACT|nr:glutathione peroxidase [Chthoniobacter flavus]EDY17326.1 Glutathione peroxidase [Chthoniobacter flavus Ellin428]TCO90104.1 glutathione peroxidase [Chthoniobacter flavus]
MKLPLLLFSFALLMVATLSAEEPLYSIPLKNIDGQETSLKAYAGKTLLIVNVASECGFTPQYQGLETLYRKYKDKGFVVLGFPCNDFGQQEPGTNSEIKIFCKGKYDVTFPLFDKLHTIGADRHPLYTALSGSASPVPGPVTWNFNKYLISRDGKILAHYESDVEPDSSTLTKAIEDALAK